MPGYEAGDGELGETLSRAEAVAAIRSLGDGDKTGLAKIARLYAARTPYDHADLLQEALCRVLSGERKWPKGVPALLFIGGVIRSIAWQWRQRDLWTDLEAGDIAVKPPQEWSLFLDEFVGLFADDPSAQAVLIAVMAGHKGQELINVIEPILNRARSAAGQATATAADLQRELERVLKKIRRRVEKYQQDGK